MLMYTGNRLLEIQRLIPNDDDETDFNLYGFTTKGDTFTKAENGYNTYSTPDMVIACSSAEEREQILGTIKTAYQFNLNVADLPSLLKDFIDTPEEYGEGAIL